MLINGNSKWDSRFSIRLSLRRRSDHGLGQKGQPFRTAVVSTQ